MDKKSIQIMKGQFDALSRQLPEENIEFWFARDLMKPLGYARWENFKPAIKRPARSGLGGGRQAGTFRLYENDRV